MPKSQKTVFLVEFRGVQVAPKPYGLVVVDGDEFSRQEIRELLVKHRHNPKRFQWMDCTDRDVCACAIERVRSAYARAKERCPSYDAVLTLRYMYP